MNMEACGPSTSEAELLRVWSVRALQRIAAAEEYVLLRVLCGLQVLSHHMCRRLLELVNCGIVKARRKRVGVTYGV